MNKPHNQSTWASIRDLIARFDAEIQRQRADVAQGRESLLRVLHERDARLHDLINWAAIDRATPALRESVKLPPRGSNRLASVGSGLLVWVMLVVAGMPGTWAALAGLVVAVVAQWHKARAVDGAWKKKVKVVLMHYHGRNPDNANEAIYYTHCEYEGGLGYRSTQFTGIDEAGQTLIWLQSASGHGIGAIAVDVERPWVQLWRGRRVYPMGLLKNGLKALIEEERRAVSALDELGRQESAIGEQAVSFESLQQAFSNLVLDAETEEAILRAAVLFAYGHRAAPRGILLKGTPGTGKSAVAAALARSLGVKFISAKVGDLKGETIGSSGNNVRRMWAEAREQAPAIVFLDECEGMLARRGAVDSDAFSNELVQTFLAEWEGLEERARVLVIGATNRADLLDDAVLSRFTDKYELRPLGAREHPRLVEAVSRQVRFSGRLAEEQVRRMAGMAGREVRNVLEYAMRKAAPAAPDAHHVAAAIRTVRCKGADSADASASWDTLILPEQDKGWLKSWAAMIANVEELRARKIPFVRNVLLYGPPGTGKTQIARTLANEATVNFLAPTTSGVKGMYLGHGANNVSQFFAKARAASPTILFIDEIDALATTRNGDQDKLQAEVLTQFLQEMDGLSRQDGEVFVVAATNRLDALDPAILQRFNHRLQIGLPGLAEREGILRTLLAGRPVDHRLDIAHMAASTAGCAGRELKALVEAAFHRAMSRSWQASGSHAGIRVTQDDLLAVLAERETVAGGAA